MYDSPQVLDGRGVLQARNDCTDLWLVFVLRATSGSQTYRVVSVQECRKAAMKVLVMQPGCEPERHDVIIAHSGVDSSVVEIGL